MQKLNWGHGIFIAIVVMLLALITLVIFTVNEKVDLVTEEYYPKGLVYEEEMQKQRLTQQLNEQVQIRIDDSLHIQFPADFNDPQLISGEIWFYKASNIDEDIKDSIHLDQSGLLVYPIKPFSTGKYDVIIDWKYQQKSYYYKESIFIEKD